MWFGFGATTRRAQVATTIRIPAPRAINNAENQIPEPVPACELLTRLPLHVMKRAHTKTNNQLQVRPHAPGIQGPSQLGPWRAVLQLFLRRKNCEMGDDC